LRHSFRHFKNCDLQRFVFVVIPDFKEMTALAMPNETCADGRHHLPFAKLNSSAVCDVVSRLPNVPSFRAATVPPTYKA